MNTSPISQPPPKKSKTKKKERKKERGKTLLEYQRYKYGDCADNKRSSSVHRLGTHKATPPLHAVRIWCLSYQIVI